MPQVVVLFSTLPAWGFQSSGPWTTRREAEGNRYTEISARSEIATPKDAGFAIFKIRIWADRRPVTGVNVLLPQFPFDMYEGPIDKTQNEFIEFAITPQGPGVRKIVRVVAPNGGYDIDPVGSFGFSATSSDGQKVLKFLSGVGEGQKLSVVVNGPPSSIQVSFDTTGLQRLLTQVTNGSAAKGAKPTPAKSK